MTNASQPLAARAHSTTPPADGASPDRGRSGRDPLTRGLLAAGVAAVVNAVILGVATAAGASMVVAQGGSEIAVGLAAVLIATVAPLALATVVAWMLSRRWPRAPRILAWVGLALAAASIVVPLTGALDSGSGIALALMHLVAGTSWFAALVTHRRR